MKKNKLYILITIVTLICFLATAALCNQCNADTAEETGEDEIITKEEAEENEDGILESGEEEIEEEEPSGEEDTEEEETPEEEEEETLREEDATPAVTLTIYQDATFSAADDVCYYRIEAQVTGSPAPTVTFSKDDSAGAFGSRKAQINLNRGETYTLTATATNSSGSATDSITLTWECDGEEVVEEEEEEEEEEDIIVATVTMEMPVDEAGWIIKDDGYCPGPICVIAVGDSSLDSPTRGFVSFDIADLTGATIVGANLVFSNPEQEGDPNDNLIEAFWVKVINWGDDALESSDFDLPSKSLGEYTDPNITINNSALLDAIRTALGNDRTRFQIMISHKGYKTNNNAQNDLFIYRRDTIHLNVRFE